MNVGEVCKWAVGLGTYLLDSLNVAIGRKWIGRRYSPSTPAPSSKFALEVTLRPGDVMALGPRWPRHQAARRQARPDRDIARGRFKRHDNRLITTGSHLPCPLAYLLLGT